MKVVTIPAASFPPSISNVLIAFSNNLRDFLVVIVECWLERSFLFPVARDVTLNVFLWDDIV